MVKLTQAVTAVTPLDDALREPVKRRRTPAKSATKPAVGIGYECRCGFRTDDQGGYQAHLRAELEDLKTELGEIRDGLPRKSDGTRRIAECGTTGGYNRHWRLGEPPCQTCQDAHYGSERARYHADPDYRERKLEYAREWRRANPEKVKAYGKKDRRARLADEGTETA